LRDARRTGGDLIADAEVAATMTSPPRDAGNVFSLNGK
jgi:hypothetical protein